MMKMKRVLRLMLTVLYIDVALYLLCVVYMLLVYMYICYLCICIYVTCVYVYMVCTYVCVSVRKFLCVVCVYCLMYLYFFCKAPQAIFLECGAIKMYIIIIMMINDDVETTYLCSFLKSHSHVSLHFLHSV
jgi:hypothetical protein